MGHVTNDDVPVPAAIELNVPGGPIVRGLRWGAGPETVILIHEPGADLDAWGPLPHRIARSLRVATLAIDLPGHGLSDAPWVPRGMANIVRRLVSVGDFAAPQEPGRRRYLVAAGSAAAAALDLAGDLRLSGLVCLSPSIPEVEASKSVPVSRSPQTPKLFIAGSIAAGDLSTARRLASASGGWAVVTSVPVAECGTRLLATAWRTRLEEEITAFLRDCQHASPMRIPARARSPRER
jgi:pimeloyl-ACP methyl ester carboxylesterase